MEGFNTNQYGHVWNSQTIEKKKLARFNLGLGQISNNFWKGPKHIFTILYYVFPWSGVLCTDKHKIKYQSILKMLKILYVLEHQIFSHNIILYVNISIPISLACKYGLSLIRENYIYIQVLFQNKFYYLFSVGKISDCLYMFRLPVFFCIFFKWYIILFL